MSSTKLLLRSIHDVFRSARRRHICSELSAGSGEFNAGSGEFNDGSGDFNAGSGEFSAGSGDFDTNLVGLNGTEKRLQPHLVEAARTHA